MQGGEIFVPRIPSTTIVDLATAIAPDAEQQVIGMRPGEKLHEEMISANDAHRTRAHPDHFVILPVMKGWDEVDVADSGDAVSDVFSYQSDSNDWFLSVEEIRALLETVEIQAR